MVFQDVREIPIDSECNFSRLLNFIYASLEALSPFIHSDNDIVAIVSIAE